MCPRCGTRMSHVHRRLWQKVFCQARWECSECQVRILSYRALFEDIFTQFRFLFSRHSRCPRCAEQHLERLPGRDPLDPVTSHPLSQVQRMSCAPVIRCWMCRLQYYDWRPLPQKRSEPSDRKVTVPS